MDLLDIELPPPPLGHDDLVDHLEMPPQVATMPVDALLHLVEVVPAELFGPQENLVG